MLTYLAVLAAVVLLLYVCYRALSGAQPRSARESRHVLGRLAELTLARAGELGDALAAAAPAEIGERPVADPLVAAAAVLRPRLAAYLEQLGQLESSASGEEGDLLDGVAALVAGAAEDLVWACRMIEGGGYRENPGIQRAVTVLLEHSAECLSAAGVRLR